MPKVVTVDGIWSTIGSYNLNHLSDYGSIETNVDILDPGFSDYFEGILFNIIDKDCRQITIRYTPGEKRGYSSSLAGSPTRS